MAHIIFTARCIRVAAAAIQVTAPVGSGGAISLRKEGREEGSAVEVNNDNNNNTSGLKSINEEELVQQRHNHETA